MKHLILALFIALFTLPAFAAEDTTNQTAAETSWLKPVTAEYVCMVTDKKFPMSQIPVPIGEKTYYGCCAGCKAALENNEEVRTGIDPVSGNPVDKATAVIGFDPDKSVYYFENEENFQTFAAKDPNTDMTNGSTE